MNLFSQFAPVIVAIFLLEPTLVRAADDYQPGPDSMVQTNVPQGEVLEFNFASSKIFPGTTRGVKVYVPKQYDPSKPACLFVCQDGIRWNAPVVFDNLIAKGEMPVTIGVFVAPGRLPANDSTNALDRFNRIYEFDGLGDNYARFLLDELLPAVEEKTASDGRPIKLSKSAADRAIGGESSGGIAAFTVAWERPDAFSRVFTTVGTYVGLRGGEQYPTLIRKFEPKPIRIFLQDGSGDLNIYGGDWWMANQTMERALVFAGYEVNHVWGDGGHPGKQGTAIFPEALRWLWHDWPQPVKDGETKNATLNALLIPGEGWQLVIQSCISADGPAANAKGEVFFNDTSASKTYQVGLDGKVSEFLSDSRKGAGQAFGPDGRLYTVAGTYEKIIAYDAVGEATIIATGIRGDDLVVTHGGNIYVTEPPPDNTDAPSKVWLIKPGGEKQVVDTGLRSADGIALSPDQTLLYVSDHQSHWVYSYQIQKDGSLNNKQRFYWLHEPDSVDDSGADGVRVDREGRLYVATWMGIQICDQAGRVQCIIPTPNGKVTNLCFGGEGFDTLFATCGDKVYKRKLKAQGAQAWDAPFKPAAPRL
jgi:sugar lactone lactonase YvrE/enterochelin esterase-like enzyme